VRHDRFSKKTRGRKKKKPTNEIRLKGRRKEEEESRPDGNFVAPGKK
jgi:hypothetical protein